MYMKKKNISGYFHKLTVPMEVALFIYLILKLVLQPGSLISYIFSIFQSNFEAFEIWKDLYKIYNFLKLESNLEIGEVFLDGR